MQDKLDLKDGDYCLVPDERFIKYFYTIKNNDMRMKETQKRAQYRLKSSSRSNDNSHASRGRIPKKARKEVNKTSQGEAILFRLKEIWYALFQVLLPLQQLLK